MSFEPQKQNTIYTSLRDRVKDNIPSLTNFANTSFNWVWTQGFAAEFREQELDKTAVYLSGLIDYAGGPVDEGDLRDLGIEDLADPEEINERLNDRDLEELTKIVSTTRDLGAKSIGEVTFTTRFEQTVIPEGTSVGVQPDNQGQFLEYQTTEPAETNDAETEVTVPIQAEEVGVEYNVGSGQITYLPSPPAGVFEVVNNEATEGGESVETNDELRERAKDAIFRQSGGGTVSGVEGYIEENVDDVDEVNVIEFFDGDTWHGSYPHSHVVVSGAIGIEEEVKDAIDESRPVAVQHVYIDVNNFNIRFDVAMNGTGIEESRVEDELIRYVNNLNISDELVDVKVIQAILNADDDIEDLANLDTYIENETIFFDSATDVYSLTFGDEMQNDGIVDVEGTLNGSTHTFVEDTDWQETDDDGDTSDDSIDWSLAGDEPDVNAGLTETVTYNSEKEKYIIDEGLITDGISQVDGTLNGSAHTFTEGTDYDEVDVRADGVINGIDWGIGGDSPDDGTDFTVTYDAGTSFDVTYQIQPNTDLSFDEESQPVIGTINTSIVQ